MWSASASAAPSPDTPVRMRPTSTSMITLTVTPRLVASKPSAVTGSGWSTAHMNSGSTAATSHSRRGTVESTTGEVNRIPRTPAAESASTSPSFAQHTPTAPAAICLPAIHADLCVFACGRSVTRPRVHAAIRAMFSSSTASSTMRAGVGTRKREPGSPIMACANASAERTTISCATRSRPDVRSRQAPRPPAGAGSHHSAPTALRALHG